jgi:hypothetical protein
MELGDYLELPGARGQGAMVGGRVKFFPAKHEVCLGNLQLNNKNNVTILWLRVQGYCDFCHTTTVLAEYVRNQHYQLVLFYCMLQLRTELNWITRKARGPILELEKWTTVGSLLQQYRICCMQKLQKLCFFYHMDQFHKPAKMLQPTASSCACQSLRPHYGRPTQHASGHVSKHCQRMQCLLGTGSPATISTTTTTASKQEIASHWEAAKALEALRLVMTGCHSIAGK